MLDKTKIQNKVIRTQVTPAGYDYVTDYAKDYHITISELVRRALDEYIENHPVEQEEEEEDERE